MKATPIVLFTGFLILIIGCSQPKEPKLASSPTSFLYKEDLQPFYHNVASGDPLPDQVIIWTRVTPEYNTPVTVSWEVATDSMFAEIVKQGSIITDSTRDFTVKVDVTGLKPNTQYYYRFESFDTYSPTGHTKTVPDGPVDQLRIAAVSCSNYEGGYFNAFAALAGLKDLDAVLHLGDYIYEYGQGVYGDTTMGRQHLPEHEILSLEDYRIRYAQYRLDPDFQKAHQMHPFICIWDDHEITNNAYITGAQNHQDYEGDFQKRKAAARQAYLEWLPIRENDQGRIYRRIDFGPLLDLFMLDERLAGRTAQADSASQAGFGDSTRHMIGIEQLKWLKEGLGNSESTWKVIGNQVIFSDLDFSQIFPHRPVNLDAWDGYPWEKQQLISFFSEKELKNILFVSGDTHASWAFEVPRSIKAYQQDSATSLVAVEFGTTSVSSPNYDEKMPVDTVKLIEQMYLNPDLNPHLKYVDLSNHGFLLLALSPEKCIAEWHYVNTVRKPDSNAYIGKTVEVNAGSYELRSVNQIQ